jgi:hypothetical protein
MRTSQLRPVLQLHRRVKLVHVHMHPRAAARRFNERAAGGGGSVTARPSPA